VLQTQADAAGWRRSHVAANALPALAFNADKSRRLRIPRLPLARKRRPVPACRAGRCADARILRPPQKQQSSSPRPDACSAAQAATRDRLEVSWPAARQLTLQERQAGASAGSRNATLERRRHGQRRSLGAKREREAARLLRPTGTRSERQPRWSSRRLVDAEAEGVTIAPRPRPPSLFGPDGDATAGRPKQYSGGGLASRTPASS
jgi:hypothetical protein